VGLGEVFGDLRARVGRSDDEHVAGGDLVGVAVLGAVQLGDRVAQLIGDRRYVGALVGARGDDHPRGFVHARLGLHAIAAIRWFERAHAAVVSDRQLEPLGVLLEVVGDGVLAWVVLRVAGEPPA
jgi:hypothetical protein